MLPAVLWFATCSQWIQVLVFGLCVTFLWWQTQANCPQALRLPAAVKQYSPKNHSLIILYKMWNFVHIVIHIIVLFDINCDNYSFPAAVWPPRLPKTFFVNTLKTDNHQNRTEGLEWILENISSSSAYSFCFVEAVPQSVWDLCVSVWWKVLWGPRDLLHHCTETLIKSGLGAAFLPERPSPPHSNSVATA